MSDDDKSEREGGASDRWRRREQRLRSQRERMKKHGASLARVYRASVLKRLRDGKRK